MRPTLLEDLRQVVLPYQDEARDLEQTPQEVLRCVLLPSVLRP